MKRVVPRPKGFTLLELLVVVAIIGLVATLVFAALNNARHKARDARRLTDLKAIATALELRRLDTGRYPVAEGWISACNTPVGNWLPDGSNNTWADEYLTSVPRDPAEDCQDSPLRAYSYWSDGNEFKLATQLESPTPPLSNGQEFIYDGSKFKASSNTTPVFVTISSSIQSPTNQSPIPLSISFSRAVIDFTQSVLNVVNGIVNGFSSTLATLYSVTINPLDNDTVVVTLQSGVVHDETGVGNAQAQFTIVYDSVRPHPALSPDPLSSPVEGSFTISINFTIPVVDFSANSITVQNGSVISAGTAPPLDGTHYTATIAPTSPGQVTLVIPQGVVQSASGATNVVSNELQTTYAP